jgi:hypothetical protein
MGIGNPMLDEKLAQIPQVLEETGLTRHRVMAEADVSALPDSKWVGLVIVGVCLLVGMLQLTPREERRRFTTWLVYSAFLGVHFIGGYLVLASMEGRVRGPTFAAALFAESITFGLMMAALARRRGYRENSWKRPSRRDVPGDRKRRRG